VERQKEVLSELGKIGVRWEWNGQTGLRPLEVYSGVHLSDKSEAVYVSEHTPSGYLIGKLRIASHPGPGMEDTLIPSDTTGEWESHDRDLGRQMTKRVARQDLVGAVQEWFAERATRQGMQSRMELTY
jgi:hypothetical protein